MFRGESGIACRCLLVGSVEEFVTPERSEPREAVARDSARRIISCAGIADDGLIQIPDLIKTGRSLNNGSRLVADQHHGHADIGIFPHNGLWP